MPTEMSGFAALCIKLDNQMEARAQERKDNKSDRAPKNSFSNPPLSNSLPPPSQFPRNSSQHPVVEAIELDSAARQVLRKANKFYTYCEKTGHCVKDCEKNVEMKCKGSC